MVAGSLCFHQISVLRGGGQVFHGNGDGALRAGAGKNRCLC